MYKRLSGRRRRQRSFTTVDLVEGPVDQEELQALSCIASHFYIPITSSR